MDIWSRFFYPAISLVNSQAGASNDSQSAHATIYHECAMFAERQYHAILKSPDALRWKLYVARKTQEIRQRGEELARAPSGTSKHTLLRQDQDRATKLLKEDNEQFSRHNVARDEFLTEAIDMYSRALEASDAFDDDGAIRLCSLWFANFEETAFQKKVQTAIDRVQSRKLIFLAVSCLPFLSASLTTWNSINSRLASPMQ